MSKTKRLFCFGFGYTCDYLGYELQNLGWSVIGTTRSPEKQDMLRNRGIKSYLFDSQTPLADPLYFMEGVTHVLISTPPGDEGDPAFLMHGQDLAQLPDIEWVGYLSTTSVYGDRDGGKVDETSELRPTSKRGSRRKRAEEQWLSLHKQHDLPVHIFRLSGIYGPGRSALDSVRAGVARRIHKPGHAFGRIHVEDIVSTLMQSINNPQPGEAYNVCDNEAAPSHKVIEYACRLLGRPPPPMVEFEDANLAPMTRSFYMDNRRTSNKKIKEELDVKLKYENYRQGLEGCLAAEDHAIKLFKQG